MKHIKSLKDVVRTSVIHSAVALCATVLFLCHFDTEQMHCNMESIC